MALRGLGQVNASMAIRCQPGRLYSWLPWSSKTKKEGDEIKEILSETAIDASVKPDPLVVDEARQEELYQKRNKSRLSQAHRRILNGTRPYDEPIENFHSTVKYKKRILGRYGLNSLDVPAGVAWPTPEEVEDKKEYVRVAYPLSLKEAWEKIRKENEEKEARIRARDEEVAAKVKEVDKWIKKLQMKMEEKRMKEEQARLEKEHLIEEVRKQFDFQISVNDERFQEALVQKVKEEKKKRKDAKKLSKLNQLIEQTQAEAQKRKMAAAAEEKDD